MAAARPTCASCKLRRWKAVVSCHNGGDEPGVASLVLFVWCTRRRRHFKFAVVMSGPNFVLLDATLPDVARLVAAMASP